MSYSPNSDPSQKQPYSKTSLAVRQSLEEIFDEFSDIISGELRAYDAAYMPPCDPGKYDPKKYGED